MAQQNLSLGTVNNDGTGDGLRDAFSKVENNTTELYSVGGWANYQDGETTPATQVISTTPTTLKVDGLGAASNSQYLPREIRGVSELWNGVDTITPINIGDSYDIRFTLNATAKTGSPNVIRVILDIGNDTGITINIAELQMPVVTTPPFTITGSIPIFCLTTFITNGGRLFLSTDAGTVTISSRAVFIKRDFKGDI